MNTYRFKSLVGNSVNVSLVRRSLANGTFKNLTIFSGVYGTGKTTLANIAGLTLTCEHPHEGQACLQCRTCLTNMKAIETTKVAPRLHIINIPADNTKEQMADLIKNIFVYEHSSANMVYIISEAHNLGDYQDAFLTELDSIPPNVYVILTTTKLNTIIKPLQSRALNYDFSYLTRKESTMLMDITARGYNYSIDNAEIRKLILSNAKDVPRDIIKYTEFVIQNSVTEDELKEFFKAISDSDIIALFENMYSASYSLLTESVYAFFSNHTPEVIVSALKDFIIRATFLIEGGILDSFTEDEATRIRGVFDSKKLAVVADGISKLAWNSGEEDIQLTLLRTRRKLQGSSTLNVFTDSAKDAARNHKQALELASDIKQANGSASADTLTALNKDFLRAFSEGGI